MDMNIKVCQSKEIDATDLNGDKVMMDLERGKYFALNSIGSRIWELIEDEISLKDVTNKLLQEYEVDDKTCENAVVEFINKMKEENLIVISK